MQMTHQRKSRLELLTDLNAQFTVNNPYGKRLRVNIISIKGQGKKIVVMDRLVQEKQ